MRLRKAPFNNAPSQFSTDGSGTYNNEFMIDGVPNTFSDSTQVRVDVGTDGELNVEFCVDTEGCVEAEDESGAGIALVCRGDVWLACA